MKKYLYKLAYYPVKAYWFIFRPNGYGVKCIIQRPDGKIIFIRNTYGKGHWNFPGGGIKKGETAEQAVRREVKEEVGIVLEDVRSIGSFLSTVDYMKDHVEVFAAKTTQKIGDTDEGEIADAAWFTADNPPLKMPLGRCPSQGHLRFFEKSAQQLQAFPRLPKMPLRRASSGGEKRDFWFTTENFR